MFFQVLAVKLLLRLLTDRCKAVKELINKHKSSTLIEVDGGVTLDNAKKLIECGADVLVSGSHVFKAENPKEIISKLKHV